jgi:hypothetical protein
MSDQAADAYYDEEAFGEGELDLSFLDDDEATDEK